MAVVILGIVGAHADACRREVALHLQVAVGLEVAGTHETVALVVERPQCGRVGGQRVGGTALDGVLGEADAIYK